MIKTQKEKVSIIVPMYNAADTIEKTIKSLTKQVYSNLEILIVDDESSDNSVELVENIALKDTRIKLIKNVHSGVSGTRNKGIEKATGEYIVFCDSDDVVDEQYVESLIKYISEDVDLVISKADDLLLTEGQNDPIYFTVDKEHQNTWYLAYTEYVCRGPMCKILKRNILIEKKILFDTTMCFGEDLCFVLKYMECCKKICLVNEIHYYYKISEVSLTRSISQSKIKSLIKAHKTYYDFISTHFLNDRKNMEYYYSMLLNDYFMNMVYIYLLNNKSERKDMLHALKKSEVIQVARKKVYMSNLPLYKKIMIKADWTVLWKIYTMVRRKNARNLY